MSNRPDPMSARQLAFRYTLWLRQWYPAAFNNRREPLLVGIALILRADPRRPRWATDRVIQNALAMWCRHPRYVRNLLDRRRRVDLAGRPVMQVTVAELQITRLALEKGQISCAPPRRRSRERSYAPRRARGV
jgi:sRNA-binding protein